MQCFLIAMQIEIASETILSHPNDFTKDRSGYPSMAVSRAQMKRWLVPQKAEHDVGYDISNGYFEGLMPMSLNEPMKTVFIAFSSDDGIECGKPEMFFLTGGAQGMLRILLEQLMQWNDDKNIQKQLAT